MRLPSAAVVRPTRSMSNPATPGTKALAASLFCALASLAASAQTLPATAPTAMTAAGMTAPIAATAPAVTATRPHRAEVLFSGDQLTVRANDSSLHQILGSIARVTGMKISGGVEEQRVFGSYGPGDASTILATLLDGTGVNMLIREDDGRRPTQLTLTPRLGGPATPITPQDEELGIDQPVPPPASQPEPGSAATPIQPPQQPSASGPPVMPQPLNNPLGNPNNVTPTASEIPTTNSVPTDSLPTPSTAAQPAQGIVDTPNQTPTGTASPVTPDQIYQKLLQMQKQKASANSTAPPQ